ncbi:MAG TPA: metalloregulator ArsR/SmtB family transcription factor [Phototrophicaceae bacterium]|nr:metalloregulator ArsR/SmtB family transcription factor [Phototrophicaceae bacterium]
MLEDRVFSALADPTRRRLLITLAEHSPKTATQLAQDFPISRQGILKHLDLLAEAGLVRSRHQGRETHYSFAPEPLADVSQWVERIGALWDARLLRLKEFVESEQANDEAGKE